MEFAVAVICSLLVDWLVALIFSSSVGLKVDSFSHTRIGQRGLSWYGHGTAQMQQVLEVRENWPRESWSSTFAKF